MRKAKENMWALPYLVGYIVWAAFYVSNPLHFDMYVMEADYLIRHSTFIGVLKAVFFTGGCWKNARYLVNIINIYVVSYQKLFDLLMPFVFILSIYFVQKSINKESRWHVALGGVGLFLLVSNGIVGSCYSYSYVLYTFPVLFVSLFLYINSRYNEDRDLLDTWYKKAGYLILVYCCAGFLEHLSCAFSVIMMWVCGKDRFVTKRKNKTILVATIISLCQTVYMNMYLIIKQTRPLAQSGGEVFSYIKANFRILILETWLSNPIVMLFFLIALIYANRKKIKWLIADGVLLLGYLIWFILIYTSGGIDTVTKRTADVKVPFVPNELWWLWAVLYVIINLSILWQLFTISETIAIAYFAGGCSTIPILVTPNTGWTISSIYIFMVIISTVMLMQNHETDIKAKKTWMMACAVVAAMGIVVFSGRIIRISRTTYQVGKIVDRAVRLQISGEWDIENDEVHIPAFDSRDVLNGGRPDANSYYMWNYCYVNGLDKKTIIVTE